MRRNRTRTYYRRKLRGLDLRWEAQRGKTAWSAANGARMFTEDSEAARIHVLMVRYEARLS